MFRKLQIVIFVGNQSWFNLLFFSSHYHANVKLETKTETIEKVLEDIKAQYDMADQDFQKFSEDANTYQSTLENLQAAVNEKYQMIHQLCYDLSKICSRFNFVDELHANIENMKQEARVIKNIDMRKNAENEIAKLIRLVEDLSAGRDPDIAVTKGKNHGTFKAVKSFVSGLWPSS
jgi:ABC-type oligopeptide transport system substrate-binding subunit